MLATPEIVTDESEAVAAVLADFQSLGDNCEFGLVQRYGGAEPLGLFRFVAAPLHALIAGLDGDFAAYGAPGDLEIVEGQFETLTCISRAHGFAYNTGERVGSVDPAALRVRQERKIAYLKRLFLEELALGEKILVHKGPPGETSDDVLALVRAVRRHGPSTVLRVVEATGDGEAGSVGWAADGLMLGHVRRFSPYETGMLVELEPWIDLCRNAHWLARERPGQPPPLRLANRPIRLRGRAAALVTDPDETGMTIRSRDLGADLKPDSLYVFSLWVWIPRDFSGAEIAPVFGRLQFARNAADLSVREAWQRIWISVRTPAEPARLRVGLATTGPGGQRIWSTEWRLTEGPVPAAGPAPTIDAGRAWSRWLPRLGR